MDEIRDKATNIANLAPTTALTALENKRASVSNLVKKTDYKKK